MKRTVAIGREYEQAMDAVRNVRFPAPEGLADRVMAATTRSPGLRDRLWDVPSAGLRDTVRRHAGRRRHTLASSAALVVSAVAIGLEARHLRRARGEEQAA